MTTDADKLRARHAASLTIDPVGTRSLIDQKNADNLKAWSDRWARYQSTGKENGRIYIEAPARLRDRVKRAVAVLR